MAAAVVACSVAVVCSADVTVVSDQYLAVGAAMEAVVIQPLGIHRLSIIKFQLQQPVHLVVAQAHQ